MKSDHLPRNALCISAGGTGGHITPGIAVAEEWLRQDGWVIFVTLEKNRDYPDISNLSKHQRFRVVTVDAPKVPKSLRNAVAFIPALIRGQRQLAAIFKDEWPMAILGMGGYSTFPAVLYAIRRKIPLYLCEQNARWGLITRLFRRFAQKIFLSFAPLNAIRKNELVTGNPLRGLFRDFKMPLQNKRTLTKKNRLFFIGGSQGAHDLNLLFTALLRKDAAKNFQCLVSTGAKEFRELASQARVKHDTICEFITDMPRALIESDFIVSRCGSGTLFEILWSKKPAFLIPYPFAAADHQKANAEQIQSMGVPHQFSVYDERPFHAERAAQALLDFIAQHPSHKIFPEPIVRSKSSKQTFAQVEIVRYIKKNA